VIGANSRIAGLREAFAGFPLFPFVLSRDGFSILVTPFLFLQIRQEPMRIVAIDGA
jgi:hypothetical protein